MAARLNGFRRAHVGFVGFFSSSQTVNNGNCVEKNNVIPKVEVHARMFAQVVYPTTESVEVKNE